MKKKKYKSLSCSRSIETDYSPNLVHELWFATPCACLHAESLQSCLTLCDPMDYSPPGSSTHGILQARILEWVAMPSSVGSSPPVDRTPRLLCLLHRQADSLLSEPLLAECKTHFSILAWEIPWIEDPADYSPWGHRESDTTEQLTQHKAAILDHEVILEKRPHIVEI